MESVKNILPSMAFAFFFAIASAASCFAQTSKAPGTHLPNRRVLATGRLTGTRELQTISISRSDGGIRLLIETSGRNPRLLWDIKSRNSETDIDNVRIADLNDDGIPEVLSLWWKGNSAALRVFHWDARQQTFAEVLSEEEIDKVRSYRIERRAGPRSSSRLVVDSTYEPQSRLTSREYELRSSKLLRVAGGIVVTTKGESGIEGQALISPSHPGPVREGHSGSAPYKTTIVVSNAGDGREITRVETDADGRFRVTLAPGTYVVGSVPQKGRFLPRASEETVTVKPGQFAKVTINFDSGMR